MLCLLTLLLSFLLLQGCGGSGGGSSVTPQQSFYFDATAGDDLNSGISANVPFKTLARLASIILHSPTTLYLKRGEVWHEPLILTVTNITVDAYGNGSKPLIDGSRKVSGWTLLGGDIYNLTVSLSGSEALGNLSENGTMMSFAAWDNDTATTFASAANGSYSFSYPNTLYIKSATDPGSNSFRASVHLRGIFADGVSSIAIRNIDITRSSLNGIEFKNCQSCSVINSNITQVGGAVIGPNPEPTPDDYLYAGNGIDFSNSSSNGQASNVTISEVFDSCLAIELYESNHTASAMQLSQAQIDRCGFAGVEISLLKNQTTTNSHINDVTLSAVNISQAGLGWSGRRYGTEGDGIRIIADDTAGSMSGIRVEMSQITASAGNGIKLGGEIGRVELHRIKSQQNSGNGILVAAPTATSLQLDLSSSIIDRNGNNGLAYNAPFAAGLRIYQNTFFKNGSINLAIYNQDNLADLRNNIFYSDGAITHLFSAVALINATINNNCYNDTPNMIGYNSSAYSTLFAFNAATGHESNGLGSGIVGLTDPNNNNFTLQANSDCRSLGDNHLTINKGFDGLSFATPPASGAHEYN